MITNAKYWLDTAVGRIRFKADREAVRRELEGHLLDRQERYLARGMTETEAAGAAIGDMGDPAEIAEELGRIHSPLWGRLWRLSQWALVIAAACLVFSLSSEAGNRLEYGSPYREPYVPGETVGTYTFTNEFGTERTVDMTALWRPKGSVKLGGYRWSAPVAWVERWEHDTPLAGPREALRLVICLKSSTWKLWEASSGDQWMILEHTATDSSGQRYLRENEEPDRNLFCRTYQSGPGAMWYEVDLELEAGAPLPAWVDIPVGFGGHTLRVDLEKGEVMAP